MSAGTHISASRTRYARATFEQSFTAARFGNFSNGDGLVVERLSFNHVAVGLAFLE
jgi:hypothetical protein